MVKPFSRHFGHHNCLLILQESLFTLLLDNVDKTVADLAASEDLDEVGQCDLQVCLLLLLSGSRVKGGQNLASKI